MEGGKKLEREDGGRKETREKTKEEKTRQAKRRDEKTREKRGEWTISTSPVLIAYCANYI